MKQPQRLLQSGSPKARALLSSLDEDVPPDPIGGQQRVLRALGVEPSSSTSIPAARPVSSRRWIPVASICGLVVACATFIAVSQKGASAPGSPEKAAAPVTTDTPDKPAENAASNVDSLATIDVHALASAPIDPDASRAPRANVRREGKGAPTASPTAVTPTSSEIADELHLLERAQAAAVRGQNDEALALVARHRREFPSGRFAVEMSVVEIEALGRAGRLDEATVRGERFLQSHPGSPYTRRVEAVVRSRGQKELPR